MNNSQVFPQYQKFANFIVIVIPPKIRLSLESVLTCMVSLLLLGRSNMASTKRYTTILAIIWLY